MGEVVQFNDDAGGVLECKDCGNQTFFVIMDENGDITYFECSNTLCKERIEFHTITLTKQ